MAVRFAILPKVRTIPFFLIWLSLAMVCSIALRTSAELHFDIQQYISLMQNPEIMLDPTYQREFIFWGMLTFLYNIFDDGVIVFLTLDCAMYLLLYQGIHINRLAFFPKVSSLNARYTYFSILLFFTFAIGIQIMYRQMWAFSFLFLAIGYIKNNKPYRAALLFIVSVFIHNAVIIALPLLLLMINKSNYKFIAYFLILALPFALFFIQNSENPYMIRGAVYYAPYLSIAFLLLFFVLFLIVILINYYKKKDVEDAGRYKDFTLYVTAVFVSYIMIFVGLDAPINRERLAFILLSLLYPLMAFYIESSFSNKILLRLVYLHLSIIPSWTFYYGIIM